MHEPALGRCRLGDILDTIGWSQQDLADYAGIGKDQISRYVTENPRQKRKMSLFVSILITDVIYARTGMYFHPRELYEGTQNPLPRRSGDIL